MPESSHLQFAFDRQGQYQIRVQGLLAKCWVEHLEGLEVTICSWRNYPQVTQIKGWLSDQTALAGLLDLVNDLGMVILTVERLEPDEMRMDSNA